MHHGMSHDLSGILWGIVHGAWMTLTEMSPYLLFGFVVAGILYVLVPAALIERHLSGKGFLPILKSTLLGIPLPLCSCGVIPVAASLRRSGASKGATTAFLLSTPQTGVDSIFVTFSLLGPVFAAARPLIALVTGLLGGAAVSALDPKDETGPVAATTCTDGCCDVAPMGSKIRRIFTYGFVTLPRDIGKALLVGLLLAGLISALVPPNFFADTLGRGFGQMVLMMLVGIPLYVCATASVPIAAALVAKGVTAGAALVFLATGPATNAATIAIIWKTMGKRTAVIYVTTVAVTSLAAGVLLDYIFTVKNVTAAPSMDWMMPESVSTVCALFLLFVLGMSLSKRTVKGDEAVSKAGSGGDVTLFIGGMTCSHCAATVERSLKGLRGVTSVEVDLDCGKAVVRGDGLDREGMERVVRELGYTIQDAGNKTCKD